MLPILAWLLAVPVCLAQLQTAIQNAGISAVFPSDDNYADAAVAFNKRFTYQPAAVAYPSSVDQISQLIQIGSENNVHVNARSGGHSYIALGVGGQDGSLVIDLKYLTAIAWDDTNTQVTVQTGNHLGDLALALNDKGRALPHGSCPFVGVGGHVGLGGWGFASRLWGMALDHVVGVNALLANGTTVYASADSFPDLFFAMRGAASSFGIVTSFVFATEAAPPSATTYRYQWTLSIDQAIAQFQQFQNFVQDLPPEIGTEITLSKASQGQITYVFNGMYIGDPNNFNGLVEPYLSTFPFDPNPKVSSGDWITAMTTLANGQGLNTSTQTDYSDTFYVKSLMTPEDKPISNSSVSAFFNYLANQGVSSDTAWFVQIETYGGANSKVNSVAPTDTAFYNRNSLFTIQFYASSSNSAPPYPDDGISFVSGMVSSITDNEDPDWNYAAYINYVDSEFDPDQDHQLYYGGNYDRLSALKSQYDPNNVFDFPTAIQGSSSNSNSTSGSTWGASPSGSALPSNSFASAAPSGSVSASGSAVNPFNADQGAVKQSSGAPSLASPCTLGLLAAALLFSVL